MTYQLFTRWSKQNISDELLNEYPRPQMVRKSYMNLNGYWDYAINKEKDTPEIYDGKILVPFSPEAFLSGVHRQTKPDEYLHYKREFIISEDFINQRVLLHFGAVDQICFVSINENIVGKHIGGYLPFTFDVTNYIKKGVNTITIVVKDYSDTSFFSRGKQKLERKGMWYTAQSGIWQTVWLESVPKYYIKSVKIDTDYDSGDIYFHVNINKHIRKNISIKIYDEDKLIVESQFWSNEKSAVHLSNFKSWSPEFPYLYNVEIEMDQDKVCTYFAMRKYSIEKDKRGVNRFMLNNRPYFHNGVLDQGYWPDGLYTAPSDEALYYDIAKMKELGFNMIRKHIKIEPARWYYHCDRIGMIVWQDIVNGGEKYHMNFICLMPNLWMKFGRIVKDNKYGIFARNSKKGRKVYYQELKQTIEYLYNFPCIAAWVPFNEGWGQFDAKKATQMIRSLDNSRYIDEASGWFDQGGGDMYSIHNYWRKLRVKPQKNRVVALTEYGGYSWRIDGHSFCKDVYGYKIYDSKKSLTNGFRELILRDILPSIKNGLSATVYTQVSDVEEEVNGVLTYDRKITKMDEKTVLYLNKEIYSEFNKIT